MKNSIYCVLTRVSSFPLNREKGEMQRVRCEWSQPRNVGNVQYYKVSGFQIQNCQSVFYSEESKYVKVRSILDILQY